MLLATATGAEKIACELRPEKAWDLSSGPGFDSPHLHRRLSRERWTLASIAEAIEFVDNSDEVAVGAPYGRCRAGEIADGKVAVRLQLGVLSRVSGMVCLGAHVSEPCFDSVGVRRTTRECVPYP